MRLVTDLVQAGIVVREVGEEVRTHLRDERPDHHIQLLQTLALRPDAQQLAQDQGHQEDADRKKNQEC